MINDPEASTDTWDAWGHYHIMTGLLSWYDITGQGSVNGLCEKNRRAFPSHFLWR